MTNIIISGYYGFENAGDEAILWSLIEQIKGSAPSAKITVLSAQPEKTSSDYNVDTVNRSNIREILDLIKKSDIFINGEAVYFRTLQVIRVILLFNVKLSSKKMGLKTAFYSNGIGPINSSINRYITKQVLEKADILSVRDEASKVFLKDLGIESKIYLTSDPVLVLEPEPKVLGKEILKKEGIDIEKMRPIVGISVRPWINNYHEVFAKFTDFISRELNCDILFIPFHGKDDLGESMKISKLMEERAFIIEGSYSPKEIMSIISLLDFLVGIRLHSLIFAGAVGTPFCGISYDPKIDAFLRSFQMEPIAYIEEIDLNIICDKIKTLWTNKINLKKHMDKKVSELKSNIYKHNKKFFSLMGLDLIGG